MLYKYLLKSMPTTWSAAKPDGMHLVSLRTWLANRITEFESGGLPLYMDFDAALKEILRHQVTIHKGLTLASLTSCLCASCLCRGGQGGEQGPVLGQQPPADVGERLRTQAAAAVAGWH